MQGPRIAACFAFQQNLIFEGSFRSTAYFLSLLKTGSYASSEMTFFGVGPRLWSKVDQVLCQCEVARRFLYKSPPFVLLVAGHLNGKRQETREYC